MSDEPEQIALRLPAPKGRRPTMPAEPISRAASTECGEDGDVYRWTMTRAWGSGPTIIWVLLNPITPDGSDKATRRMIAMSFRWGFGSMVVASVYPVVAPTLKLLHAWRRRFDHETFENLGMPEWKHGIDRSPWAAFIHNQKVISGLLDTEDDTVVAAWGYAPSASDLEHFLRGIRFTAKETEFGDLRLEINWKCLGRTPSRAPVHPNARGSHREPDGRVQLRMWRRAGDRNDNGSDYP